MIHVKKQSKAKLLIILSIVMAVLVAGYFVLVAVLPEKGGDTLPPKYDKLPWEGANQLVFPFEDTSAIEYIDVFADAGNENLDYGLEKSEDGTFSLWYKTEKDEKAPRKYYRPDIISKDPSFTYSSLYAMDSFGQGQVARFFYLRSAITSMYFTERISLKSLTESERRSYLEEFGFIDCSDPANPKDIGVVVSYGGLSEDGKHDTPTHTIWVGGKNVSGNGYYVMLLGEKDKTGEKDYSESAMYIYATNNSNIGYATQPYTYYVNPSVISAGLSSDGAYEPYLIDDYQQWKNTIIYDPDTAIDPDAEVIVKAETSLPAERKDGGLLTKLESVGFQLGKLSAKAEYERLVRLLKAQKLTGIDNYGKDEEVVHDLSDPLYITLVNEGLTLSFPKDKSTMVYRYEIIEILSALTEDGEVAAKGAAIPSDATALRVAYNLYIDGAEKPLAEKPFYSVFSLSDTRITDEKESELRAKTIGNVNVDLQITYDKENFSELYRNDIEFFVADVIAIYDSKGKTMTKITEESIVVYRYYMEVNGKRKEGYYTAADPVAEMDEENKALFLSVGEKKNGINEKVREHTEYLDIMCDYLSYKITAIPYMIKREELVHFKFQNASERDPFYGESIYENLLKDARALYGMNNPSCQAVLLHLGGAGTSTTASNGYSGSETVAIGLTPENMRKYGLYEHTIFYALPRGIVGVVATDTPDEEDLLDDYDWSYALGFTVYVSAKQEDGSRYIASDLYDVVVRVVDEKLDFLELSFEDFWARQVLVSIDIKDIKKLDVSFNFSDLKGDFEFLRDIVKTVGSDGEPKDIYDYKITPGAGAYESKLVQMMAELGNTPDGEKSLLLRDLYNKYGPEEYMRPNPNGVGSTCAVRNDFAGTYFFKQTLGILYSTLYTETYTKDEQKEILDTAKLLASLSFTLDGKNGEETYSYEFYRASDRRVLVKIYKGEIGAPISGAVSDFAISTQIFKKIVGAFDTILNAGEVDGDAPYYDRAE